MGGGSHPGADMLLVIFSSMSYYELSASAVIDKSPSPQLECPRPATQTTKFSTTMKFPVHLPYRS